MKSRTIIAVVVLLLSSCAWAGEILAGDAQRVWLVRPAADGKSCDVFLKELGVPWRVAIRNQSGGVPTAAVAAGDRLHLFYPQRQHVVLDAFGEMRVLGNLPGDLIASCSGDDFGGAAKDAPAVFVLVQRNEPPQIPAPETQMTTTEAVPFPNMPQGPCECLYRSSGNEWALVAWRVILEKQETVSPEFIAVLRGKGYRLGQPADKPDHPFILSELEIQPDLHANWSQRQTISPAARPLNMIALKDRLTLVSVDTPAVAATAPTTTPAEITLSLARYNPANNAPLTSLPISRNQEIVHWPAEASLGVSSLGEQLAFYWRIDKTTYFALCSTTGAIEPAENVTQTLESMPDIEWASDLYNYFLLGIVAVIGVGMFYRRLRTPPTPFLLPPGLAPGNLFKRLLAAIIDYLPFYFAAGAIFLPRDLGLDSMQHFIEDPSSVPPSLLAVMIYTVMLSQGAYIVYGTIMEMIFGATVGKMLMRLRAVNETGGKPNLREASLRNTSKIVELSMLMSSMAWLMMIFVLLPLLSRSRQRLGDMIARTSVVEAGSLEAMQKAKPRNPENANKTNMNE